MPSAPSFDDERTRELLATISHAFRSPLTALKGCALTLLRHHSRLSLEEQREFLEAIVASSDQLEHLVHRALTLASLEGRTLSLKLTTFPLSSFLEETLAVIARQFPDHHFALTWSQPGLFLCDPPSMLIRADSQRLQEALTEVLENAARFSPAGSDITVAGSFLGEATRPDQNPPTSSHLVEIAVHDQGVGLTPEQLAPIFAPFARVDHSLTRLHDGLGLGLALCQGILALHGGSIWAESHPDQGSIFHLLLPVELSSTIQRPPTERELSDASEEHHDSGC